jgi:L-ascorbate metabolism protein UlaG (beta-lactamase superfamily)
MANPGVLTLPGTADHDEGSLFFIGNATVLLRYGGFTILTDPTFVHRHEEVPLGYGLSTKRLTDPAVEIDALPPVDLVLLSHFHGDHFDRVAQERLAKDVPVVTTAQATEQLAELGFTNTYGLSTWERLIVTKGERRLRLTSCPGRHGPGITDMVLPDVMGTIIESETVESGVLPRVYISGDTLVFDDLHEIGRRFPLIDLGLLHLGGTRVMGILVTMDAEQGVDAIRIVGPRTVVPIHYDDYDVFTSSLEDFLDATTDAGLRDRVHPLARGETYYFGARRTAGV